MHAPPVLPGRQEAADLADSTGAAQPPWAQHLFPGPLLLAVPDGQVEQQNVAAQPECLDMLHLQMVCVVSGDQVHGCQMLLSRACCFCRIDTEDYCSYRPGQSHPADDFAAWQVMRHPLPGVVRLFEASSSAAALQLMEAEQQEWKNG